MTNHVAAAVPAEPPMPASMNRHPRAVFETLFLQPLVAPQSISIFVLMPLDRASDSLTAGRIVTATIPSYLTATLPLPSL
jgi:hypothetical protein